MIPLVVHVGQFPFTTFLTFSFLTFHRATVKKGVTFRTATPSNSLLWDITLDMGADGVIAVVCHRKAPIPGKRQVCSLNFIPVYTMYVSCVVAGNHIYCLNGLQRSKRIFSPMTCWLPVSLAVKSGSIVSCKAHQHLSLHLRSKRQTICSVQG